ncbi:hypothetical protein [uncultured Clostridium sp.]|uniref:hypothetical protein n=1 Tax=uncultured Clostridium sp. TaxID=59620 RepID=UPI00260F633A|nr:hypothetical protein [uncultured Clostridium sp.]
MPWICGNCGERTFEEIHNLEKDTRIKTDNNFKCINCGFGNNQSASLEEIGWWKREIERVLKEWKVIRTHKSSVKIYLIEVIK